MNYRDVCHKCFNVFRESIVPYLEYHSDIYESCLDDHCSGGDRWLDLGCGTRLLSPWSRYDEQELTGRYSRFIGLDYNMGSLKRNRTGASLVRGDISSLPFPAESFDVVTSNMVFEHLREPEKQLSEVWRVLKPGGLLIFSTPNAWGYSTPFSRMFSEGIKDMVVKALDGRNEEDVFPAYYRINTSGEIRRIAEETGYSVQSIMLLATYPALMMIPPLAIIELILIRFLMLPILRQFRPNIIAVLRKN